MLARIQLRWFYFPNGTWAAKDYPWHLCRICLCDFEFVPVLRKWGVERRNMGTFQEMNLFHWHAADAYLWWTQTCRQCRAEIPTGSLVHRHTCMACQHHDLLGLLDYGVNLRYSYTIYMRYISSQETRRFGNSFLNQWMMVFFIYIAYLTLNHPYELLYSFFSSPTKH